MPEVPDIVFELERIHRASPDIAFMVDARRSNVVWVNAGFVATTGLLAADTIGGDLSGHWAASAVLPDAATFRIRRK